MGTRAVTCALARAARKLVPMNTRVILIALSLVSSGCGGDDPNSQAAGGAPSGGGAGGMATGGSSGGGAGGASGGASGGGAGSAGAGGAAGSASGVTRGAISLHILSGPGCSLSDQFLDWPTPASGHPVTDSAKVQALENGTTTPDGQPVKVICRWLAPQAPHMFQTLTQTGPAGIPRLVDVGARIEPGKDVQGGVSVASPDLPQGYASSATDPCIYNVISTDDATRSVWGRVHCGTLVSADGNDTCSLGDSYFFFENCTVPTP
jgi:hypothetical protein